MSRCPDHRRVQRAILRLFFFFRPSGAVAGISDERCKPGISDARGERMQRKVSFPAAPVEQQDPFEGLGFAVARCRSAPQHGNGVNPLHPADPFAFVLDGLLRCRRGNREPARKAMQTVTQISEHPRKPGRYIVEVDGREFAVVNVDALTETNTRIGVVIDDARAAQLREAGEVVATYDRALNLLAFRARSSRELSRRLKEKGAS